MATLVDYMLGLFSNPETAEAFLKNPDDALGAAGLADVSTDQLQAVAASVAPTGLTLSGLDRSRRLREQCPIITASMRASAPLSRSPCSRTDPDPASWHAYR
jgi:hypothetical protein